MRPPRRPWRRRAILALLGQAWAVQGIAVWCGVWAPIAIPALVETAPVWALAVPWIVAGALGIGGAIRPQWTARGYGAVMIVPTVMAASWVIGTILGQTGRAPGSGVSAGWTWATVVALIAVIVDWDEITPPCDGEDV